MTGGEFTEVTDGAEAARFIQPLRRLVYIMAGVLVLLMVTVTSLIAWRIIHPRPETGGTVREMLASLPAGIKAGQVSLDGNRLAVVVNGPDGSSAQVLVFDLAQGRLAARLRFGDQ